VGIDFCKTTWKTLRVRLTWRGGQDPQARPSAQECLAELANLAGKPDLSLSNPPLPDPAPYTLHPTPCTLNHAPCTLRPAPYTSHPTFYTLHPTPYTLHPTPYTLHPTPYTIHPTPQTLNLPSAHIYPGVMKALPSSRLLYYCRA
jgi:hypothetical protein